MINSKQSDIPELFNYPRNKSGLDNQIIEGLNNISGEGIYNPVKSGKKISKIIFNTFAVALLGIEVIRLLKKVGNKKEKEQEHIGFPDEVTLKDGKIRVSLTQGNDYEVFVNGGLVRTLYMPGKPETPNETKIYNILREVGIDPDLV